MKILGVGGHSKVVINTARLSGNKVTSVFDDDISLHGADFFGYKVKKSINAVKKGPAIIAIGDNKARKNINDRLGNIQWKSIIHPNAVVPEDVEIGEGSIIMAGSIIQPGTKIGRHCIINTGACIDHDCNLEDYVHIAPNSSLAGGVCVGEGSFIGIGSTILQYMKIGKWVSIGAGSVVIKNLPSYCTSLGVPAKIIKFHNE